MKPRTFILLILVLIVFAIAVILGITAVSGGLSSFLGNDTPDTNEQVDNGVEEPGIPTPTATAALQPVVVAKVRLPVGEILTDVVLDVEIRPITNEALVGGYSFTRTEQLEGKILKAEVASGQEI
jgi:flagella basal body P-ring formation protein FlgA